MTESCWSLDGSSGDLLIRTGVAGRAAKMGHRLTIAMQSWQVTVRWVGAKPTRAELTVPVDSLAVLRGEGGATPLTGPAKGMVRSQALKSLDAKRYPQIQFVAAEIAKTADGYRLSGTVEIHGVSRPQLVDLTLEDRGDVWALSTEFSIVQSDFGVKPYSLLMGSLRVADAVTIAFTATYPK